MKPELIMLTLRDINGDPYETQGRIVGTRIKGFDLPSGAWSAYGSSEGCKPAKFILWVPKWKRKARAIRVRDVLKGLPDNL